MEWCREPRKSDYHIHTTYSDGKCSPREMVEEAVRRGMTELGFSDHSYTPFDLSYCMKKERIADYLSEIHALAQEYAGRIRIFCGIEQDYYAGTYSSEYDYAIGSVHYVCIDGNYYAVDESVEVLQRAAQLHFHGDIYAVIERYFENAANVIAATNADVIGHFDLISKKVEQTPFFDVNHPRYVKAWQKAADVLLKTGKPFEINTGAISRGYRTTPYPSEEIRKYLQERGASFLLSSDAHHKDYLCFQF